MGISIEQFRSRIKSHDNFVKTKDHASLCFKDRFWNKLLMIDVLFKCILFANTETSYTVQDVESSDVLVYTNDVLHPMLTFHCL